MRTGTHHFINEDAAVRYYKPYGFDRQDVQRKAVEGEIAYGKPTVRPGERIVLIDGNTRYAIESE